MLFAELLHHGLELLHLLHGLEALLGQGPEDDADTEGKHQDGDAPVPHKGMEEGQNGQQGAGDDREHAEVHGLRQVIGSRGQHGAVLGAEPPVHGHGHFAAVGRREQIGAFEREAPHVALHAALEGQVVGIGGGGDVHEVVAHDAGPVEDALFDDALFGERAGARFFLEAFVGVPREAGGVILAVAERRGGDRKAEANGAGRLVGGTYQDVFAQKIIVGVEADDAGDAHAVDDAGEGQAALFPGLEVQVGTLERPLAGTPRGLAVDGQAEGRGLGRFRRNEVHLGGIGLDGFVVMLQRKGAEDAAAGVDDGGIERGFHLDVGTGRRREHRQGRRGRDSRLRRRSGRGRGFLSGCGALLGLDPAHVFGQRGPRQKNGDCQGDGQKSTFIVHDDPVAPDG